LVLARGTGRIGRLGLDAALCRVCVYWGRVEFPEKEALAPEAEDFKAAEDLLICEGFAEFLLQNLVVELDHFR
jgi:hypothetical protein